MVATSWPTQEVRCASSLNAGTHHTLQDDSAAKAAASKLPNEDTSHSGHASAGAQAGPVRFFPVTIALIRLTSH